MRIRILVLATLLVTTAGGVLATSADCSDGQRAGSGDELSARTAPFRQASGSGACEGEHWDGEDSTGSEYGGSGVVYLDPNDRIDRLGVYYRSGPEPSKPGSILDPSARVMAQGSPGWKDGEYYVTTGTLYAQASVWGVGAVAASGSGYQDLAPCIARGTAPCAPQPGPGPDGNQLGSIEAALWFEDHTDQSLGGAGQGNLLARALLLPQLTMQTVGEGDCTQDEYENGLCTRDNTAVTVELLA